MIDTERLIRKAAAYGIDAAPVVRKLDEYAALLVEYNQKVNLTAITDAEGIEDRHFIDSLLLAARPEVCGRMVDVGTGAGFPGIVAKLFRPELDLTLMEPTGICLQCAGRGSRIRQGARRGSRAQAMAREL